MRFAKFVPTFIALALLVQSGCVSKWLWSGDEQTEASIRRQMIKEKLQDEDRPTRIAQIGSAAMLQLSPIENVGLVTRLRQTGGTVQSSAQREKMLDMMRRRDVDQPNAMLDNNSTALAVITCVASPAARKGDVLDAVVKVSTHAEATDLQNGWLMETPLVEMSILGGEIREGFDLARASGSIVTNYQINGSEENNGRTQGIIVGAARLLKERNLGITVDANYADAITMSAIVPAINKRFTYFDGHKQSGIATPRDSNMIELAIPPRYELDPFHFVNVVLQLGFNENDAQKRERLSTLQRQLREASTVREACWQLEASGEAGIPILAEALSDPDPEIQFYVAHALAYLDDKRAVSPLKNLCLREPAFRAMCLNGLIILDDFEAEEALQELVHAADAEVKYGAVRALRERDPSNVAMIGRQIGKTGQLLEIPSSGTPLVALSLFRTPEVVIFGETPQLHIAPFHYVNRNILINRVGPKKLTVSHLAPGEEDRVVTCNSDLSSTLEAIAEVGGNYGDWVRFLRECHSEGLFIEPFAMNPIPKSGRNYQRVDRAAEAEPGDTVPATTFIAPEVLQEDVENESSVKVWNPLTWGN
ncbi:MAG: flagellar basal body P-ring protein FlgI [Planctomycetota bacterium]